MKESLLKNNNDDEKQAGVANHLIRTNNTAIQNNSHLSNEKIMPEIGMKNDNHNRCQSDNLNNKGGNNNENSNLIIESIRTRTGLEIGYKVQWPGCRTQLVISTCLPETALAPLFHGTQWAGTRIWNASIITIQYLLHKNSLLSSENQINERTKLLELGCGLGIPGMIIHAMTDCTVVLTDMDDLLDQLNYNVNQNFKNNNDNKIKAQSLDWSRKGIQQLLLQEEESNNYESLSSSTTTTNGFSYCYDIVINCDCIFEPLYGTSWKQLLECQEEILRINPRAYILTCVERRTNDGIDQYIQAASARPKYIRCIEKLIIPFDHPNEIELYRLHGCI